MSRSPRILMFAPSVSGGIAEYASRQAEALQDLGAEVLCLVAPGFLGGRPLRFRTDSCLIPPPSAPPGLLRRLRLAWGIVANRYILAWRVVRHRPDLVLLDSYSEYLSPLWIDPHILLSRFFCFRYGANLHDPVRSHRIGPAWWHRLSVWLAFEPLDFVLVHQLPAPGVVPNRVRIVEVPHGPYELAMTPGSREEIRKQWGIPSGAEVFLSFGFVRDGKNLDLVIEALKSVPEAWLVVAGSVASSKDRTFSWYRDHASRLGVSDRCLFYEGFIPEEEAGRFFAGADHLLLCYSSDFHSQSGVLNMAVHARKTVVASGAASAMTDTVRKFRLGVVIDTGSSSAIVQGMKSLLETPPAPLWDDYEQESSWEVNAARLLQAAGLGSSSGS